jgi:hypothetical protein
VDKEEEEMNVGLNHLLTKLSNHTFTHIALANMINTF